MIHVYLNNYCTEFMFSVAMVSIKFSSTKLSLIDYNFHLDFKISLLCVKLMNKKN